MKKSSEQKKKYMRQWKIDHGSEKNNAVEEVRKLKIRCHKYKCRSLAVAFYGGFGWCKIHFSAVRPAKKHTYSKRFSRW